MYLKDFKMFQSINIIHMNSEYKYLWILWMYINTELIEKIGDWRLLPTAMISAHINEGEQHGIMPAKKI